MLAIQAIVTQCLAFTFTFTGSLASTPSDGITDISGTVTMTASVHDIVVIGLDAEENHGNAQPTVKYRWNVGKRIGGEPPVMTTQDVSASSIALSDGHNGIDGPGVYSVACDIMVGIRINGTMCWSDGWVTVGSRDARFVAVGSLTCGSLTTADITQERHYWRQVLVKCGLIQQGN